MHVYMGSADFDRNRLNADTGSNNSSEKHGNRKARQCVRRERGVPYCCRPVASRQVSCLGPNADINAKQIPESG
jgi:hypothetical protein